MGSSPGPFAAFHARHLMTPRHPPRALRSLTTPIRPRPDPCPRGETGRTRPHQARANDPINSGGRASRDARPAPSNDPTRRWFEPSCDPFKGSTFVDELCHYHTDALACCVCDLTTGLGKSGRAAEAARQTGHRPGGGAAPRGPATPRGRGHASGGVTGAGVSPPRPPGWRSIVRRTGKWLATPAGSRRGPARRLGRGRCRLAIRHSGGTGPPGRWPRRGRISKVPLERR